jgi:hypothetical protein
MRTRPRRLLLFAVVAGVVGLAAGLWLLRPTAIKFENALKIRKGMTLGEVETLLGGPARDETTGPVVQQDAWDAPPGWLVLSKRRPAEWPQPEPRYWRSDRLTIATWFDDKDRVVVHAVLIMRRADESPLDMIRRWLRL